MGSTAAVVLCVESGFPQGGCQGEPLCECDPGTGAGLGVAVDVTAEDHRITKLMRLERTF